MVLLRCVTVTVLDGYCEAEKCTCGIKMLAQIWSELDDDTGRPGSMS